MIENLLVLALVIVGFGPMVLEFRAKKFDIFNIKNAFILYYIIQLGFSGLISIKSTYPSEIGLSPVTYRGYYIEALIAALIGLLCFQLGYYFLGNSRLKIPRSWNIRFKKLNVSLVILLYFGIGFIAAAILVLKSGGLSQFLNERETFRTEGISGQGYLVYPATHLLTQAVVVYMLYIFYTKKAVTKIHLLSIFLLLVVSIAPAFIMGFRGLIVLPILECLVIWNYKYKVLPILKMIPISILLIVSFLIYGIVREIPPQFEVTPSMALEVIDKNPELVYAFLARSKGTEVVASEIKKLEETGEYELGYKSVIESFTIFIPGALWPDKPVPSSVRFTTYFFGDELAFSRGVKQESWGGISPTILGEAYWHFGWFGVTIGLALFGAIIRKIYTTFINNKNNIVMLMLYAEIYPLFVMMAEAVQGYANSFILYLISFVFTIFVLKLNFFK